VLAHVSIHNIAVIEKAELSLDNRLNILSGETGAGKSILIDAVLLVLGGRADYTLIRTGCSSAQVEAVFTDIPVECAVKLAEWGWAEEDGSLLITREITTSSRSVSRVNGHMVTLSQLRTLTAQLLDVYGQHDQLSLLNPAMHQKVLDAFGGEETAGALREVREAAEAFRAVRRQIQTLFGSGDDRERTLDMLRYQIQEIEKAHLLPGEEEELRRRQKLLSEAERVQETVSHARAALFDGESGQSSALEQIQVASQELSRIAVLDPALRDLSARVETVGYELEDLREEVHSLRSLYEFDAGELEENEARLAELQRLKRKYGATVEAVIAYHAGIRAREEELSGGAERLERLERQAVSLRGEWFSAAEKLSQARHAAAANLSCAVERELADLGMVSARFRVQCEPLALGENEVSSLGLEGVQFLLSANAGEAPRPLEKVASGGEMSRIMLALKVITADLDGVDCMIFDEIDAGISGAVSLMVARKLAEISRKRQVVCITHTAQIAAMADSHSLIQKIEEGNHTFTRVLRLAKEDRIREISRLLGGETLSAHSLAHALDMADWCEAYKRNLV